jgi:3-deoxy-D-manno-octulosonate 8-phosphate phosphatase KdsC-like HAD superfamily phosphatase
MNDIKFIVFDFDGVFTDGKCYFDSNNIIKYYNVKDGMGLKLLRDNEIA